ncbi:hypothetical protein [Nodularia sp. UHCC 0506]|nr:hypothetical protein [Nodularia sp. UHCC 0506]MEA5512431.1 hypothetical protein [Nodularia sp. UHCC 0506]
MAYATQAIKIQIGVLYLFGFTLYPIVTADRAWAKLTIGAEIQVIR